MLGTRLYFVIFWNFEYTSLINHDQPKRPKWEMFQNSKTFYTANSIENTVFLVFWFFTVLGFKRRASHLVGRHYTTWATPPASFAFVIFLARILHFSQGNLRLQSSFVCLPCRLDDMHAPPHLVYLLRLDSHWLFAHPGLDSWSSQSQPPKYLRLQTRTTISSLNFKVLSIDAKPIKCKLLYCIV
jgi:hypothetical protein